MKTESIKKPDKLIIIGTSAGGISALKLLLHGFSAQFPYPVVIVAHRLKNVQSRLEEVLQTFTRIPVKEAEEKEAILPGRVYIAPPNYHLLFENDKTFSLSVDEPENLSRPSIDVSFISASEVFKDGITGIILTGANADGARGLLSVKEKGGEAWVQDPEEAQVETMPIAALEKVKGAKKLSLKMMAEYLAKL